MTSGALPNVIVTSMKEGGGQSCTTSTQGTPRASETGPSSYRSHPGPAVTGAVPAGTQESSSSDEEMLAVKSDSEEVSSHRTNCVSH